MVNIFDKIWSGLVDLINTQLEKIWNFLVRHHKFVYFGLIAIIVLPFLFK